MSAADAERLINLLPAIYRARHDAPGEPLRALLRVIAEEIGIVERDLDELYDNWFIETCAEWLVPYIGDLLGVRGLAPIKTGAFSQRAFVANTLAYRRAKGTGVALEQIARDLTGWNARVVEFFERLATTQYLNHVRPGKGGTLSLRDANALELLNTPFGDAARTGEVRHIDNAHGKYNIPNVGIFLWRLSSYWISRAEPCAIANGRYTFNPLGLDAPLFNRPRTETALTQITREENVPGVLRRRALSERGIYFGKQPVLEIFVPASAAKSIPSEQIEICDLSDWHQPVDPAIQVAVDPVLGRLTFRDPPHQVRVSYAYGFSGDLGGGPYNRREPVAQWLNAHDQVTFQIGVTQNPKSIASDPNNLVNSLAKAITRWNDYARPPTNDFVQPPNDAKKFGIIAVMDSATHADLPNIEIPANGTLAIVAADWQRVASVDASVNPRHVFEQIAPDNLRAHIHGDLIAKGTAANNDAHPGNLILDGLLIEGQLEISAGNLGNVRVAHCTLVRGVNVDSANTRIALTLARSICGAHLTPIPEDQSLDAGEQPPVYIAINLNGSTGALSLTDCIVDDAIKLPVPEDKVLFEDRIADGAITASDAQVEIETRAVFDAEEVKAIAASGARVQIETSTVFGKVKVGTLYASNSIFTDHVEVTRRQEECVRFCYVPFDSRTPRRFHCQPIDAESAERVAPQFTAREYGAPGYAQLAQNCPREIARGADDEGEMGAFHFLQQTQRLENLRAHLDEYVRFGLEAGIIFAT